MEISGGQDTSPETGTASMRPAGMLMALCMAIIAGSAGAIVYLYLGVSHLEAAIVAAATLIALVLYNALSARIGFRSILARQLTELSQGESNLARQLAEMDRRLAALEGTIETAIDHSRAMTDPLAMEIGELQARLRQLGETVAELAGRRETLIPRVHKPEPADSAVGAPDQAAPSNLDAIAVPNIDMKPGAISDAIAANRIDVYLQPIVSLPQRKVRSYEVIPRLRGINGDGLWGCDFIPQAESSGLMPRIDMHLIFRCVQLVRRLLLKDREIGLFCSISRTTLTDANVFPRFLDFMAANRAIAPSLRLQFTQDALHRMGAAEHESLAALLDHGYRFSLNHVTSLRLDEDELAKRGFRDVKVHVDTLLRTMRPDPAGVAHGSLSDLLARLEIDLIVDQIEDEQSVIDLLNHEVRYGQGSLFSPPRPVRGEALPPEPPSSGADPHQTVSGLPDLPPSPDLATDVQPAGPGSAAQIARGLAGRG
jgi:cyclic-di-GMP phosphodiesterase TipF (flagellum assembly factor)